MNHSVFYCSIFVLLTIFIEVKCDDPKIKTPLGQLQGKYLKSRGGKTYSAFLGIPYAEQPKRFEAPKPVKSWEGVKNATEFGSKCLQSGFDLELLPKQSGSEDCLYLNVYTPDIKANFPVMVWIHGGGYQMGDPEMHGGEYYMDEKIVLVTVNYRLGSLGFLSTGDGVISGNFGLKDQNLALRWVQKNIEYFGGDKGQVTLTGQSAGAGSVAIHLLSPKSKGLFHRAIAQSGSALNPWTFDHNGYTKKMAAKFAKNLGCQSDDSKIVKNCLKMKTETEIIKAQDSLKEWYLDPFLTFVPVIETPSNEAFLAECPFKILEEGRFNKVSWLVTAAKDEGQLLHAAPVIHQDTLRNELNEQWDKLAPLTFQYDNIGLSEEKQKLFSDEISIFYFGGKKIEKSSQQELSDLYSDRLFIHGIQKQILFHAKHSPVYAGIFGFPGLPSTIAYFGVPPDADMVTHGDDLKFFHNWSLMPFTDDRPMKAKEAQEKASKMLVKLWVQFASGSSAELKVFGVTWPKVSKSEIENGSLKWLLLDEKPQILNGIFDKRMKFWDDVLEKYKDTKSSTKDEL